MLFLPSSIQIAHAFESHEHIICSSDVEHHFHEDDIECVLCHLQADSYAVLNREVYDIEMVQHTNEYLKQYNFFKSHQHLSFSLRGPPAF